MILKNIFYIPLKMQWFIHLLCIVYYKKELLIYRSNISKNKNS